MADTSPPAGFSSEAGAPHTGSPGHATYLVLFPPDDLRGGLDLVHVLMEGVSRLLIDDFQKHFLEKENKVSKCWAVPQAPLYSIGQPLGTSRHFLSQGLRKADSECKKSQPPIKLHVSQLQAQSRLLTLSVEVVMRDANVHKALQDLRTNNPQSEGRGRFRLLMARGQ